MYILIVDFSHSDNIESSIVLVPSKAFNNIFDHPYTSGQVARIPPAAILRHLSLLFIKDMFSLYVY